MAELKTKDIDETQQKPKEVKPLPNQNFYDITENDNLEAFENLNLSNAELSALAEKGLKSLKSIGDIIEKAHELTPEEKEDFLTIKKIIKAKKQEADNPKTQLDKIKAIVGESPEVADIETIVNIILDEVIAQVPTGMSYEEFIKEYDIIAKPKKKGFFAKLFKRNK